MDTTTTPDLTANDRLVIVYLDAWRLGHGGSLYAGTICRHLDMATNSVARSLKRLERAELARESNDGWTTTPAGQEWARMEYALSRAALAEADRVN